MSASSYVRPARTSRKRLGAALNLALLASVAIALTVLPGSGMLPEADRGPRVVAPAEPVEPIEADDLRPVAAVPPTDVYTEDFERGADGTKSFITAGGATQYVGPGGMTYTADPNWNHAARCNGVVVAWNDGTNTDDGGSPAWTRTTSTQDDRCSIRPGVQSYNGIRTIARALGQVKGGGDNNSMVSTYTECNQDTAGNIPNTNGCPAQPTGELTSRMFESNNPIAVTPNRYYTFAVDAAAGCQTPNQTTSVASDPQYQFQLVSADGSTRTDLGTELNPCRGDGREIVNLQRVRSLATPSALCTSIGQTGCSFTATVRSLSATQAIKFTGSSLKVAMYNEQGATNYNDGGFDNIRIQDVTPTLEKSWSPSLIGAGGTTQMTITVLNRTDNLAKSDFSFTDTLSPGLTISGTPTTTCPSGAGAAASVTASGNKVVATGLDLTDGQASCTVTVNVTVPNEGTYTNGAANIDPFAYVSPPTEDATLTVRDPRITFTKALGSTRVKAGDQFTPQIRTGSATGTVVASTTTTGTGTTVGNASTGVYRATTGTTYHLTEASAGGADLTRYDQTISCTDARGLQTGLPTNQPLGTSLSLTPVAGAEISCTVTNTGKAPALTVQKVMNGSRTLNSDQFTVQIRTGSATGAVVGTTSGATTTGTGSIVTPGTGTSTLAQGTAGTQYFINETGGGLTNLLLYNKTVTCLDPTGLTTGLPTDTPVPASFTAALGADVRCTLNNRAILPEVDVTKTFTGATVNPTTGGGTATYTVTVKNTSVAGTLYGALTDTPAFGPGVTVTGATWTGQSSGNSSTAGPYTLAGILTPLPANTTHTYTVNVSYTGTTTATCAGPNTGLFNSASLPAGQETGATTNNGACGPLPSTNANLTMTKAAAISTDADSDGKGDVGDVVTYTFVVSNSGNVQVNNLVINDPKIGAVTCSPNTVPAGGSRTCTATYTIKQADVNAGTSFVNTATATGTPPGSTTPITSPPASATTPLDSRSSLTIAKNSTGAITDVDGNGPDAGDTVAYTFVVTNTGTTTVTGVAVNDPKIPTVTCTPTTLAPGAVANCSGTYTLVPADITAGQVVNSATGTGTPPTGPPVVSPPDTKTIPVPQPPNAIDDARTALQGATITLNPLTNDTLGASGKALVPSSVQLFNPATNTWTTTSFTVAGQGTWSVNATTGVVTFVPVKTFTGTATGVTYRVANTDGATDTAVITPTYTAVTPVANPDVRTTPYDTTVTVPVLGNDTAGDPAWRSTSPRCSCVWPTEATAPRSPCPTRAPGRSTPPAWSPSTRCPPSPDRPPRRGTASRTPTAPAPPPR